MAVLTNIARDTILLVGVLLGLSLIAADFDYPTWVEALLGFAGFWLMTNCVVRVFPRGMWPFTTTQGEA